ncbi:MULTISPECIES: hypothetical protein [Streptomyces]|uniref:hypothetical protein n=1 Tax=Streptomyces TaxID=1883 RepID=UPI000A753E66|nr:MULTISPECIES: hypothetical protein [Streptomyces]
MTRKISWCSAGPACLRWRNADVRHGNVPAAECRERAHIRSEQGIRWGGRRLAQAG